MSQQQTPSATGSDQTTGTVQVVLVDNDILALKMLREIMSAWPRVAITWTEHNGSDAFDHYRQCESGIRDLPDLFITDISMRGLSGVDMSRAIRYTNGTMPILGITSYEPTQFYHDAADAGMQAVIGKNELSALKSIIMEVADTGARRPTALRGTGAGASAHPAGRPAVHPLAESAGKAGAHHVFARI